MLKFIENSATAIVVGVSVCLSAWILSSTARDIFSRDQKITVKGSAERILTADVAKWTITIRAESPTLAEAFNKLETYEQKINAHLAAQSSVSFTKETSVTSTHVYYKKTDKGYNDTNIIEKYSAEKYIVVESKDVNGIAKLAKGLDALIGQGVNLRTVSLEYYCLNLDALKADLLGESMKNAYTRAHQLASTVHSKVGALQHAHQGVFQITPELSNTTSSEGFSDNTSIRKKITAITTVQFSVVS